jgi:histidinol dehydrogenase
MNRAFRLRRLTPEDFVRGPRQVVPPGVLSEAGVIVERVRREGAAALREYATRLDGLPGDAPLRIERPELDRAVEALDVSQRELLERTAGRIRRFARAQRGCLRDLETRIDGARMGHRFHPVPAAGCYAPGGRHPLPSTVLMTAVTAREAGVETVLVATPRPDPIMLAAAGIARADAVLPWGGAHAIAGLAYGVEGVPAVDVIVGPGNAWVTAAKQIVAGMVRIDALAGPSELLVVADGTTDPALVAADLLGQAEHDPLAVPVLVSLDESLIQAVEAELASQLVDLPSADVAVEALGNGCAIVAGSADEAVELCNRMAPEHLQWMAGDRTRIGDLVHYGGLFLGSGAAEVLGDYGAGPNHVLPTGGSARARGGLSVVDFLKLNTWLEVEDGSALDALASDATELGEMEGLTAHARAAQLRRAKR